MEQNNNNEDPQESVCSLSEIFTFSEDELNEINPLQEIFGPHDSSSRAKDDTENSDLTLDEDEDMESYRMSKRQRHMEYRIRVERKRRRIFNEKVDYLQGMMRLNTTADLATKIDNIIVHIKRLEKQRDTLAMAYTENPVYAQPYYGAHQAPCYGAHQAQFYGAQASRYGAQAPYMSPWGCYAQGIPIMHQQYMPYIPQYNQVHNTAQPGQTKAQPEQTKP